MKKNLIILLLLAGTFILTRCKKDPAIITPSLLSPTSSMYYFPLTVGSYWIYQAIEVDSSENILGSNYLDSLYISGDTIINLKTYAILKSTNISNPFSGTSMITKELAKIVRDSSGYIVDTLGDYIKHDDFSSVLNTMNENTPISFIKTGYMTNQGALVTVPAGTFTTINYQEKVIRFDSTYMYGIPKYSNHIMADSVGVVYKSITYSSTFNKSAIRLVRYHIAP